MASSKDLRSGLDWTDVTALIMAVEALHGVHVNLTMSVDGGYAPYRVQVVAVAMKGSVDATGLRRSVSRKRFFPSNDALTMEGLVFRLIHELDNDCTTMWTQERFT